LGKTNFEEVWTDKNIFIEEEKYKKGLS